MPVGDEDAFGPAGTQGPGHKFRGFAGADDQGPAITDLPDRPGRLFNRDRGHRDSGPADSGLVPGPAPGGEGTAEEPVEDRAGDALDQRQFMSPLDLTLDLGLADDHRVEPGGYPEEVERRVVAAQRVEVAGKFGRADSALAGKGREDAGLGDHRVVGEDIDLGPVAGRDDRRFRGITGIGQLGHQAGRPAFGQGEPFAQLQRSRLV